MTRSALLLPPALLAAGLGAAWLLRQPTAARWQATVDRLRWRHKEVVRLRRQNRRLAPSAVPASDLDALRRDRAALPGARRQLDLLKKYLALQTRLEAARNGPAPLAPGLTPMDRLTDMGSSTPETAARTFFWAVRTADTEQIARNLEFTAEARTKVDAALKMLDRASREQIGSPENLLASLFVDMYRRATGVQVQGCSYSPGSADEATWTVRVETMTGRMQNVSFPVHRTDSGWHEVVTVPWLDRWARYLR